MKYFMNINYSSTTATIYDEGHTKRVSLKEIINLYESGELMFDLDYLKNIYTIKNLIPQIEHDNNFILPLLKNKTLNSNKEINFLIPVYNTFYYKEVYQNEFRNYITKDYIYNTINDINKNFEELLNSEDTLIETKNLINDIKTIEITKENNNLFFDLKTGKTKYGLTVPYIIRNYFDIIGKDFSKDKSFAFDKKINIDNMDEVYFLQYVFNNIINININHLSNEEKEYLENTKKIIENKFDNQTYEDDIKNFISINNEGSVIADSVEEKNKPIIEWFNESNEKVLVLGKPEGLEKYKNMGIKNSLFINLDDLSSKKDIDEIQTENKNYTLNNKTITIIDNVTGNISNEVFENAENLRFDIKSNRPVLYDKKLQNENIKNGDVKTIIRNIEVYKIFEIFENNLNLDIEKYFKSNILNKNIEENIENFLKNFNINLNDEKIKKFLKISKKSEINLKDIINKYTKYIENTKNGFEVNLKEINIDFNLENQPNSKFIEILETIDKKNQNNYLINKLNSGNNMYIENNNLFCDIELKFEGSDNEKVEYYSTQKIKDLIENSKDIDKLLVLNAEKLKSNTSTLSNVFLYMIKNKNFKNKVFVSSNPVYNKIAEIEIIFKSINLNLFNSLEKVLENYNSRKMKDHKENFLGLISKRYILKRNSEELSKLLNNSDTIKNTSFLNPKHIGNLKKEKDYFENIREKLNERINDIIEISIARLKNNSDFDISNKVEVDSHKEKYLDFYFQNYNNFQILLGNKLNSYEKRKLINILTNEKIDNFDINNLDNYKFTDFEKILKNNIQFKKIKERRKSLIDSFYDKIMNNKFKKFATFDIETNELLDGIRIKNKHINNIKDMLEKENGLTQKEKEIFSEKLKYNSNISDYLNYNDENGRRDRTKEPGIENIINHWKEVFKHPTYYSKEFENYKNTYDENLTKNSALEKIKIYNKITNRIKKELLGEDVSFKEILMKSLNLKKMRRQLAEIKVPNTLKEIEHLNNQNQNSLVLTTSNDVINELEEKLKEDNKNVIVIKSTNKNEIMKNLNNEKQPYIILSGYKMLSEHIENNFEGEIILNDLPYNYASLEQSINSIKKKDIEFWYLHNEEEEFEKLFKFIISNRNKEISQIMNTKEEIFENFDIDEDYFKESFIKNVFNKILNNMNEEEFDLLINKISSKFQLKEHIRQMNNSISEELILF